MRKIANPSSITTITLQWLVDMLDHNIGKAQCAIQAAQMRRLCVDFLNVNQLHDLHAWSLATAKLYDSQLIVEYPSDFFHVELSYVYTKDDVVLVLHLPMVPKNDLLWLMCYWSFPIPDDYTAGLIPRLDLDVLTISNGNEFPWKSSFWILWNVVNWTQSISVIVMECWINLLGIHALEPYTHSNWMPF